MGEDRSGGIIVKEIVPSKLDLLAIEMDTGEPMSAGARVSHVLAKGVVPVDLTSVPLERRPEVYREIGELIARASAPVASLPG
jgi:hypothetical protein